MLRQSLVQSRNLLEGLVKDGNTRSIGSLAQLYSVSSHRTQSPFPAMTIESSLTAACVDNHCRSEDANGHLAALVRSLHSSNDCQSKIATMRGDSQAMLTPAQIQVWNKVWSPGYLEVMFDDENQEENQEDLCWRADSVRRKRKKKMNKHKHAKRRKLNRHRK